MHDAVRRRAVGHGRCDLEGALGCAFARPRRSRARARRTAPGAPSTPTPASNERLEFLGDAVLGLVVTDHVFRDLPGPARGRAGQGAGLGRERRACWPRWPSSSTSAPALLLGKGEDASGGREKPSILADAMEAVIGAVYLDGGWDAAATLVLRLLGDAHRRGARPAPAATTTRPGSRSSRPGASTSCPATRSVDEGPDHAKRFFADGAARRRAVRGTGEGRSKKQAEQAAARDGVARLLEPPRTRRRRRARTRSRSGGRCLSCPRSRSSAATSNGGRRASAIKSVEVNGMRSIRRHPNTQAVHRPARGRKITGVERRGKYLARAARRRRRARRPPRA